MPTNKAPNLLAILDAKNRPVVLFSNEDITSGPVGYPSYAIDGYGPGFGKDVGSAYRIMRNIVLYTAGPGE